MVSRTKGGRVALRRRNEPSAESIPGGIEAISGQREITNMVNIKAD